MERESKNRGFSFIELAIALGLMGLLVATYLQEYKIYKQRTAVKTTVSHVNPVRIAMLRYYVQNHNRLPCPADPSIPDGEAGAGVQQIDTSVTPPRCATTAALVRVDGARDADVNVVNGNGGLDSVMIGSIPYVDLGLSPRDTYDAWGRRYGYAVTERIATIDGNDPLRHSLFEQGTIQMQSGPMLNGNTEPRGTPYWTFMIWSYGSSMRGGYTSSGRQTLPCDLATKDSENCDNDAQFLFDYWYRGRIRSLVDGPDFYDGYVLAWRLEGEADDWARMGQDMNEAYNSAAGLGGLGRIGINVKTPQESLDVGGSIRTPLAAAGLICDVDGNNCYASSLVGADDVAAGTRCANDGPLTGIGGPDGVYCTSTIKAGLIQPKDCEATGQVAGGVNPDGSLLCVNP